MKTFQFHDEEGRLHAFEINIPLRGRVGVSRIAAQIPNAKLLKKTKDLSGLRGEDVFCEFELNSKLFTIEGPFGDNSRYLIGSNPPKHCPELELIEKAFINA